MDVVGVLIDKYNADVLLPVKITDQYNRHQAKAAILTLTLALQLPLHQANETVKGLLAHGAIAAQADMHHISALNYAVQNAKMLIVETMHFADSSKIASACNFIAISGRPGQFNPMTVGTPLLTALRTGKSEMIESLLRFGAKTHIDFESFAQAYKRSFENASNDPEVVKKVFHKSVEQPVVVALQNEMVDFVDQLIEAGEDVNTLPTTTHNYLDKSYRSWNHSAGKSLLDLVQERVASLQDYLKPEDAQALERPAELADDSEYLNGYEAGSYSFWAACHDLRDAKALHRHQVKRYETEMTLRSKKDSAEQVSKEQAVNDMIQKLLRLEHKLIKKGAKSFSELHPGVEKEQHSRFQRLVNERAYADQYNEEPYKTKMSFNVTDLTPAKEADYIKLFEAPWNGDVEAVKSLCLRVARPLHIAVYDLRGFSPYSIAAIRGHFDLAQVVVEIAKAQYQPDDKTVQYHYSLGHDDDNGSYRDDTSEDGSSEGGETVRLQAQLIDEAFTVDDIAALEATTVKSRVSPSTMVAWHCQVGRALEENLDNREARNAFGSVRQPPSVHVGDHTPQSWEWFNAAFTSVSQANRRSWFGMPW